MRTGPAGGDPVVGKNTRRLACALSFGAGPADLFATPEDDEMTGWCMRGKGKHWPPRRRTPEQEARFQCMKAGLKPRPCVVCGKKAEAHHPDLLRAPLKVIWLCRSHHRILHSLLRFYPRLRTYHAQKKHVLKLFSSTLSG